MTNENIIEELQLAGPEDISIKKISEKYGVGDARARQLKFTAEFLLGGKKTKQQPQTAPKDKKVKINSGISEKELRLRHDNKFIVNQRVKDLEQDKFLTTPEFIQFCRIRANAGYKQILEHPDFDMYHGKASGTVYWGHPDSINKLKEEGVLT